MMSTAPTGPWPDPDCFIDHVRRRLDRSARARAERDWSGGSGRGSAVLLPFTQQPGVPLAARFAPTLIMNKRSEQVRQPGDLCYPGGSISALDRFLSFFLRWPVLPLARWPRAGGGAGERRRTTLTARLLATGLREAWEEMRLNPLRISYLGMLPVERLVLFDRRIHPLTVWVPPDQKYIPNWEVARIVYLPLPELLKPGNYARYRPLFSGAPIDRREAFPCFIHKGRKGQEILWGVSYRITMSLMALVFDFEPPPPTRLPLIEGTLSAAYLG